VEHPVFSSIESFSIERMGGGEKQYKSVFEVFVNYKVLHHSQIFNKNNALAQKRETEFQFYFKSIATFLKSVSK